MKKTLLYILLVISTLFNVNLSAQEIRIDPPFWWIGMNNPQLQLLVHSKNIGQYEVNIQHEGIHLLKTVKTSNPNYLFIYLEITDYCKPGTFTIKLSADKKTDRLIDYTLHKRDTKSAFRKGFDQSDCVYLLMPDRFANGNPGNDNHPEMLEKADRKNADGRHGGDLEGIIQHLDYISSLGMTAIWLNPFLENNMPAYSYHGYAISDFYKTDPRLGSNSDFKRLVSEAHSKGLKIIMDQVMNHCATNHYFIKDLPDKDWIHQWPVFTKSSFRGSTIMDPYASEADKKLMTRGWFDTSMPDLNQTHPELAEYLIQNSIWWIEFSGLDGIRMDTHQYADELFMAEWSRRIMKEYPNFSIVGELWIEQKPLHAYWMKDSWFAGNRNSNLEYLTDFPLYVALRESFNDKDYGWNKRVERLYYCLAEDILYQKPANQMIFVDNHDLNRFFTTCNQDMGKFTLGMAFLLTTRGMPQIQYGTEILMTGYEHDGHGQMRIDFPGGWSSDRQNAFIKDGRSNQQNEAWNLIQKIANWRKNKTAIHFGKLTHYLPENDVYVYFRYNENENIMIVLNYSNKAQSINTERFKESIRGASSGLEIINNFKIPNLNKFQIPATTAYIIELNP